MNALASPPDLAGVAQLAAGGAVVPERLRRGVRLARHTSIRVGGPADLFCEVESEDELARLVRAARRAGVPVFALGGGTNLVVSDRGIRGLTVKLGRGFAATTWRMNGTAAEAIVGAAANLKRLVLDSVTRGLTGLEFAEGIPGTAGGGVLMNAGAFGGELGGVVTAIRGVTREGEPTRLRRAELSFAYRRLDLPRDFVVSALELALERGDPALIAERIAAAKRKRSRHQPLGFPNAGSIFKNPSGDFAGRLIESAGLKGLTMGGAQVSPMHANFIVNLGTATASDVKELMRQVRDAVWLRSGVWLEPEVRLVGEW